MDEKNKKPYIQQIDYKIYFRDEWTILQEIKSTLLGIMNNPDFNYRKLVNFQCASQNIVDAINRLEAYREKQNAEST